jgi:hypothetical protein
MSKSYLLYLAPLFVAACGGITPEERGRQLAVSSASQLVESAARAGDRPAMAVGIGVLAQAMPEQFGPSLERVLTELDRDRGPRALNCTFASVDRRTQRAQASCTPATSTPAP